jgi:hypothetical protein
MGDRGRPDQRKKRTLVREAKAGRLKLNVYRLRTNSEVSVTTWEERDKCLITRSENRAVRVFLANARQNPRSAKSNHGLPRPARFSILYCITTFMAYKESGGVGSNGQRSQHFNRSKSYRRTALVRAALERLPAIIRAQAERAGRRFIEFFTATIRFMC